MNNLATSERPKQKLRVVEFERPWTALQDRLTGDAVTDRKAILQFCSQYGVSVQTVIAKIKLMGGL
jgi:hypothetical protein